jgi:FtsP/CotA-like multicopper oxidase with cupredoxin domain
MPAPGFVRVAQLSAFVGLVALAAFAFADPSGTPSLEPARSTADPVDRVIEVDLRAVPCPEGYDNAAADEACLGYGGQIPGPTWVLEEGQRVQVRLNHSVTESLDGLEVEPEVADHLDQARYSLHRHGVSVANCEDGVSRPLGTEVCGSAVGPPGAIDPAGSVTYNFTASFPGPWHYHDHAKGLDVGAGVQPVLGTEAIERGLYGSFLVLEDGETTDHAFDLHLIDAGANGGIGLNETVEVGERFDIVVTGLGNKAWDVELEHDEAGTVAELEVGPGVSRSITVAKAQEGTYSWRATSPTADHASEGEVQVG